MTHGTKVSCALGVLFGFGATYCVAAMTGTDSDVRWVLAVISFPGVFLYVHIFHPSCLHSGLDMIAIMFLNASFYGILGILLQVLRNRNRVRSPSTRVRRRCTNCTYDLTGNISGICPECGCAAPRARRLSLGEADEINQP